MSNTLINMHKLMFVSVLVMAFLHGVISEGRTQLLEQYQAKYYMGLSLNELMKEPVS